MRLPLRTDSTHNNYNVKANKVGVPWWPSGKDPGLSLLWPGFTPGWGTEIL